jgi:hypothetical protein
MPELLTLLTRNLAKEPVEGFGGRNFFIDYSIHDI